MKLIGISINRPVPLEGSTDETKHTIISMYAESDAEGRDVDGSIRYGWTHCNTWREVINWLETNEVGQERATIN